jgi:ABC-type enterochelin transport system permease subunit
MPAFCAMIKKSATGGEPIYEEGGTQMDSMHRIKMWIGGLTEIGMMLLALAIVAALLVGGTLPFFGGVVANIIALVAQLGSNGLVGLIVLGIILWLFSHRSVA